MKKLLSIFTISIGTLAFTLPTVTACKSKSKVIPPKPFTPFTPAKQVFNLNNIKLYKLKIHWAYGYNPIEVHRSELLSDISSQIIKEYNQKSSLKKFKRLKKTDFMYGANLDNKHSWAIEVMNINGTTPLSFNKAGVAVLNFPESYTVLKDNALKVKITTTNQHVNIKTAIVNGYLNQFIYTNANINQGHDLVISKPAGFIITPGNATVFDISKYIGNIPHTDRLEAVDAALTNYPKKAAKISKLVFTALNKQLISETKTLNDLGILKVIDVNKAIINFKHYDSIIDYFTYLPGSGHINRAFYDGQPISGWAGKQIFAQVRCVGGTIDHYIPTPYTYLYLYLGETS